MRQIAGKREYVRQAYKVKTVLLVIVLIFSLLPTAFAGEHKYKLNIPQMNTADALNLFAEQTGSIMLFSYKLASAHNSKAIIGSYTTLDGLNLLLKGTDLTGSLISTGVVSISPTDNSQDQGMQMKTNNIKTDNKNSTLSNNTRPTISSKKSILASIIAMLFGTGVNAQAVDANQNPDAEQAKTEQSEKASWERIEVTATKRSAWLQDVPMSIAAISGEMIEKRNLHDIGDYLNTVPGVTMQDRGGIGNSIVIRGISSNPGFEKEAVGAYFGETPLSGLTNSDQGYASLQFVDIERVEVLRGPQGTLYGSGSMGGTVRIMPRQPDLSEFTGSVAGSFSQTGELGGSNNSLQGVVNIPIVENTLALRAVAYRFDDSGYIENIAGSYDGPNNVLFTRDVGGIAKDQSDIGAFETRGVRLSLAWQVSEDLRATLGHVWQAQEQFGSPKVFTDLPGKFQQVLALGGKTDFNYFSGKEFFGHDGNESTINLTNLIINYDRQWGSFLSSSSWITNNPQYDNDLSYAITFLGNYFNHEFRERDYFTQEVRFVSSLDGPLQFVAGFYYEDKSTIRFNGQAFLGTDDDAELALISLFGVSVPPDAPAGFTWEERGSLDAHFLNSFEFTQKAFFGELSYEISDTLTATLGVRDFQYDEKLFTLSQGYLTGNLLPKTDSEAQGDNSGQTYKGLLDWKLNRDTTLYVSWSEGFRPGETMIKGAAVIFDPDNTGFYTTKEGEKIPIRDQADPDSLENFELGYKGVFLDNRVTINLALYQINWEGLPVGVPVVGVTNSTIESSTIVNVGESESKGLEFESQTYLTDNLRFDFGASYNKSTLTKSQETLGQKGDDLPGSADVTYTASLDYRFELAGYPSFLRADYTYVGDYKNRINDPDTAPISGDYTKVNLKAGMDFGRTQVDVFVTNLTNDDAFTYAGGRTAYRIRPRTIGLNLSYQF